MDPVTWGYLLCLKDIAVTILLVKATEEIVLGPLFTLFVPHTAETLLNSNNTQHFSVSRLTSYEILLLTTSHITFNVVIILTKLLFSLLNLIKYFVTAGQITS